MIRSLDDIDAGAESGEETEESENEEAAESGDLDKTDEMRSDFREEPDN